MVRVRNVAQDRNRVLRLGKCGDRLPTTETGSSATDDVSSVILGKLASNPYIYATHVYCGCPLCHTAITMVDLLRLY